jgi:hypothetical protein
MLHTTSWTVSETEKESGEEEQKNKIHRWMWNHRPILEAMMEANQFPPSVVCGRRFTSSGFSAIRRAPACGRCLWQILRPGIFSKGPWRPIWTL